jgi:hypothetical protein
VTAWRANCRGNEHVAISGRVKSFRLRVESFTLALESFTLVATLRVARFTLGVKRFTLRVEMFTLHLARFTRVARSTLRAATRPRGAACGHGPGTLGGPNEE